MLYCIIVHARASENKHATIDPHVLVCSRAHLPTAHRPTRLPVRTRMLDTREEKSVDCPKARYLVMCIED